MRVDRVGESPSLRDDRVRHLHLRVLRNAGLVLSRRDGLLVIYRIADPSVVAGYLGFASGTLGPERSSRTERAQTFHRGWEGNARQILAVLRAEATDSNLRTPTRAHRREPA